MANLIGNLPNQVPTNGDLGKLAFKDLATSADLSLGAPTWDISGNLVTIGTIKPQQATTALAPAYVKGAIYFDTTLNKLRVGGATAWETVTSI